MFKKLFQSEQTQDADELIAQGEKTGCVSVTDCPVGQIVKLHGRIYSVTFQGPGKDFLVDLANGSTLVSLVFTGRTRIIGLEPGLVLDVQGRLQFLDNKFVIFNPKYFILSNS